MTDSFPLASLLSRYADQHVPGQRGAPGAQMERLHDTLSRYQRPNPFKPGDVVTPRAGVALKGAGNLHIVLEVIPSIMPSFLTGDGSTSKRYDTRIAWIDRDGNEVTAWVESYRMEFWPPQRAAAGALPVSGADSPAEPSPRASCEPFTP